MKGTYVLIIENHADTGIEIGKRGFIQFKEGYYAYIGSALSGLEQRVGRHLRALGEGKKLHWHIDYLLASPTVAIKGVVVAKTDARKECELATTMGMHLEGIPRFGCTDCSCPSHLFYSTSLTELEEEVYRSFQAINEPFRTTRINPV